MEDLENKRRKMMEKVCPGCNGCAIVGVPDGSGGDSCRSVVVQEMAEALYWAIPFLEHPDVSAIPFVKPTKSVAASARIALRAAEALGLIARFPVDGHMREDDDEIVESSGLACVDCGRGKDGGECIICGGWVCDACTVRFEDEGAMCPNCDDGITA